MNYIKIAIMIAAFAGGYWTSNYFSQKTISGLNQTIGGQKNSIASLTAGVAEQNAAIEAMKKQAAQRAAAAQAALAAAKADTAKANRRAAAVLASRPPVGANVCTAAEEAFRFELKTERQPK